MTNYAAYDLKTDFREWVRECYWGVRNFFRAIRRLVEWAPIIWNDYEGDWSSILRIWAWKLNRAKKHIRDHKMIADWQAVHDSIQVCEDALFRLMTDDYVAEEIEAHWARYPRSPNIPQPDGTFMMAPMGEDERADFLRVQDLDEQRRQSDVKLFCEEFARGYRTWWD